MRKRIPKAVEACERNMPCQMICDFLAVDFGTYASMFCFGGLCIIFAYDVCGSVCVCVCFFLLFCRFTYDFATEMGLHQGSKLVSAARNALSSVQRHISKILVGLKLAVIG